MHGRPNSKFRKLAALAAIVLAGLNCQDDLGPEIRNGRVAFLPSFQSAASAIVDVNLLRITLTRNDSMTIAADTVVQLAADQDSVDLDVTVPLLQSTEMFFLELKLVDAAGDTVFRGGPSVVTGSATGTPAVAVIPIRYTGTGSEAAGVRITDDAPMVLFGDTLALGAEAFDTAGAAIPGTPIAWSALDTLGAFTPARDTGLVVGGSVRGPARVVAELLTGQMDTVSVLVQPVPDAIAIDAGDDQVGNVGQPLADPLSVVVTAVDGLGVEGVPVIFAAGDNGFMTPDTAVTDSMGFAASNWTLASTIGPQQATAHVSGLTDSLVTFNATGESNVPDSVRTLAGDGQNAEAGTAVADPPSVIVLDAQGNPLADIGVAFAVTGGGGSVTGANPVSDSAGVATVGSWILGAVAGANELTATVVVDSALNAPVRPNADSAQSAAEEPAAPGDTLTVTFAADGVPGAAAVLVFTTQPTDAVAGDPIGGTVALQDTLGNLVTGDDSTDVSLSVTGGTPGAAVLGTNPVTAEAGLANLTDASVDLIGNGYQLVATATGMRADTSDAFAISSGPAATIVVTPALDSMFAIGDSVPFTATTTDSLGNPVTGAAVTWSSSDSAVAIPNADGFAVAVGNGTATITATAGALTGSGTVVVEQLAVAVQFTAQPSDAILTSAISPAIEVSVVDSEGAVVTAYTADVTLALETNPNAASLIGDSVVAAVAGVATFTNVSVNMDGVGYTLEATSAALVPDTSAAFDVVANGIYWINPAGGNWSNPANWDRGAVPTALDTVFITANGTYTVTLDQRDTVAFFNVGGMNGTQTFEFNFNQFAIDSAGTVGPNGILSMANGILEGRGDVSVSGTFDWNGGTIRDTATVRVESGGTLNLGNADRFLVNARTVENLGTAVWTAGHIHSGGSAIFLNGAGGTLDIQADVSMFYNQAGLAPTFRNDGAVTRTVTTGLMQFGAVFEAGIGSTFDIQSGQVQPFNGGTISGDIVVTAPAELLLSGGTFTFDATSSIAGDGIVNFTAGTTTIQGAFDVTGTSTHITGGVANFNSAATSTTTNLTLTAGRLGGTGVFAVSNAIDWQGGDMGDAGTTRLESGGTMTMSTTAAKDLFGGRLFESLGTTVWTDGPFRSGAASTFLNAAGATFFAQANQTASFTFGGGAPTFQNDGAFVRDVATGTATMGFIFNGSGTVDVQTGRLDFNGSGTSSGNFTVQTGATIGFGGGTNTLDPSSSLAGSGLALFFGGTNNIDGDYDVTATQMTGGTNNFNGTGTVQTADYTQSGGILGGTAVLSITNTVNWTAGDMRDAGTTRFESSSTVTLAGGSLDFHAGRTVENHGTATWTSGNIRGGNSTFLNAAGATFLAQANGTLDFTFGGPNPVFQNDGTFTRSVGTGVLIVDLAFNNDNTADIQTGEMEFTRGGGVSTGDYTVQAGATLNFGGGTVLLDAASTLTGVGRVLFSGGINDINGTYNVTTTEVTGGNFNFNAGGTAQTVDYIQSGGDLDGTGLVSVSNTVNWTEGDMSGTGTTRFEATTTVTLAGGNLDFHTGRTVENLGTATWTSGNIRGGNATFLNAAGATFIAQANGTLDFAFAGPNPVFQNDGTFVRNVGTGLLTVDLAFNNDNTADVQTGEMEFTRGGGVSTGDYTVQAGATLNFGGGTVLLDPASTLTGVGRALFSAGTNDINGIYNVTTTEITGGNFNFNGAGTAQTVNYIQSGGDLDGTGLVSVTTSVNWTEGDMSGTGTTRFEATTTVTLAGGNLDFHTGRTVENLGVATWTSGNIRGGTSTFINGVGATFRAQSDGLLDFIFAGTNPIFQNDGNFIRDVSTGTVTVDLAFNNDATADIQTGQMTFTRGGVSMGAYTVQAGATLAFNGSTKTLDPSSSLTGAGRALFTGGTSNIDGTYNVATTEITGGTNNFRGITTASTADYVQSGGALGGTALVSITNSANWTNGDMQDAGTTRFENTSTATLAGGNLDFHAGRTVENLGTATWTTGNLRGGTSTFTNGPSAIFNMQADATFDFVFAGTSPQLINDGTINIAVATGLTIDGDLINNNVINANSGPTVLTRGSQLGGAVVVNGASSFSYTGGGGHVWVDGLGVTGAGTFSIAGGTVSLGAAETATLERLDQTGGTFTGDGTTVINSVFDWSGGDQRGLGTTNANGTGTWSGGDGAKNLFDGRVVNVAGTITWTLGRIDNGGNPGTTVNVLNGGMIDAQADAVFLDFNSGGTAGTLIVQSGGTFRRSVGTGTATIDNVIDHQAGGVIDVQSGTLAFITGGTFTGPATVAPGTFIDFIGATHSLANGHTATGGGTVRLVTGTLTIAAGETATFDRFAQLGGTLGGAGTLATTTTFDWSGGAQSGTGTTVVNGTGLWDGGGGAKDLFNGRVIDIAGTITWTLGRIDQGGTPGTTINVLNGAVFDMQADDILDFNSGGTIGTVVVQNGGTLRRSVGTGTATIDNVIDNQAGGLIEVLSGRLAFNGGGTFDGPATVAAATFIDFTGATHTFLNGQTITGAGTVQLAGGLLTIGTGETATIDRFVQTGGTVTGAGTFSLTTLFNWSGGIQRGTGTTVVNGTGTWDGGGGAKDLFDGRAIDIAGIITWTLGRIDQGGTPGTSVNIVSGGMFDVQADDIFDFNSGGTAGSVVVQSGGILRRSVGAGTATIDQVIDNQGGGLVQVLSGTLDFIGGGTLTGPATVAAGTFIDFSGSTHTFIDGQTVTGAGTVRLTGGTMTIGTAETATFDQFVQTGGTMGGAGTFDVNNVFDWSGGQQGGTGITRLITPGTGSWTGGDGAKDLFNGRTIEVGGTITWSLGRIDQGGTPATTISVLSTGLFDVTGDVFLDFNSGGTVGIVDVAGTFRRSTAVGTATIDQVFNVLSGGQLDVQTGTLDLLQGGSQDASVTATIASGAVLNFGAGTHTLQDGWDATGVGEASITGGTVTAGGSSGTINFDNLTMTGGTLNGTVDAAINTRLTLNGGVMTDFGQTILANTATGSTIGGTFTLRDGRTLVIQAPVDWNGGNLSSGGTAGTQLTVSGTGSLNFLAPATLFHNLGGTRPTFANNGLVTVNTAGTVMSNLDFSHTGTFDIQAGTYDQNQSGDWSSGDVLGDGILNVNGAAFMTGGFGPDLLPGTSPGILAVNAPAAQPINGTITIEVDGAAPGTGHDQLNITNTTDLTNATLDIAGSAGFNPVVGQTLTTVTYPSSVGNLPTVSIAGFNAGVTALPRFGATSIDLLGGVDLAGGNAERVGVDLSANLAFVTDGGTANLRTLNGATNTLSAPLAITNATNVQDASVFLGDGRVYVADGNGRVHVLNGGASPTFDLTYFAGLVMRYVEAGPPGSDLVWATGEISTGVGQLFAIDAVGDSIRFAANVSKSLGSGTIRDLAYNAANATVYVAFGTNQLFVVDTTQVGAAPFITVGTTPTGVAANAVTNRIYVANTGSSSVTVIDGSTNGVFTTISVDPNPEGITVDEVNNRIYVAHGNQSLISVIDGLTSAVIARIKFDSADQPKDVAINPGTGQMIAPTSGGGAVVVVVP